MSEILETDGSGNVVTEYLNGAGEILGKIRYLPSGIKQVWYYLHDGLGSTTYLLDNYGNIVNTYYYEPFGKCWNVSHDPGKNTRFTGKEYEEDIGLYYFANRWYDPDAGRFVTKDPAEEEILKPLTINRYIYALNNPINFTDPTGEKVKYGKYQISDKGTRERLDKLDELIGNKDIIITDGDRAKNAGYGVKDSYHKKGRAADIYVPGMPVNEIAKKAAEAGFNGICTYDDGHVHVDTRDKIWNGHNGKTIQNPGWRR